VAARRPAASHTIALPNSPTKAGNLCCVGPGRPATRHALLLTDRACEHALFLTDTECEHALFLTDTECEPPAAARRPESESPPDPGLWPPAAAPACGPLAAGQRPVDGREDADPPAIARIAPPHTHPTPTPRDSDPAAGSWKLRRRRGRHGGAEGKTRRSPNRGAPPGSSRGADSRRFSVGMFV
jgi:hypothetical protein